MPRWVRVIAETPADFRAWWAHQLAAPQPRRGQAMIFESHCGGCHAVRGTEAAGILGPDLSHLMQRQPGLGMLAQ
jgi:cytochrome c oxidase subunit 2